MTFNTATGLTDILTDSGTAVMVPGKPNFEIRGGVGISTSASGEVITITNSGGGSGGVVQQVRDQTATYSVLTAAIPFDDTIPQVTEGTQLLSVTITPTNASNILMFDMSCMTGMNDSGTYGTFAVFQDGGANAIYATSKRYDDSQDVVNFTFRWYMVAGTTSATTFTLRVGPRTPKTLYINGNNGGRRFGGVAEASFIVTEFGA